MKFKVDGMFLQTIIQSYSSSRSGLRWTVLSKAFFSRHFSISGKFPDSNTSGTFQPLNSGGLV